MIERFVLMTRGRTGSTAIIDEINAIKNVSAEQELFRKEDFRDVMKKLFMQRYESNVVIPYELWKLWKRQASCPNDIQEESQVNRELVGAYLDEMSLIAQKNGKVVFGFKLLSHHFVETTFLKENIIDKNFGIIYLTRNLPRQVISGIIAKRRGVYNATNYRDDTRYKIDLKEFENLVRWEAQAVQNDLAFVESCNLDLIKVSYEDFLSNRQDFFSRVLGFLGVGFEMPITSSYSVMIKDLRHTVENIDEVLERITEMGMKISS
jgi:LPS sulfotransferase NodH